MFDRIGDKIKVLAMVLCILGIIVSVILGFSLFSESFGMGVATIAIGVLASWTGSFCLYGFGELIEETTRNREINEQLLKALASQNGEKTDSRSESASRAASVGSYTIPRAQSVSSSDSWRCKKCNSINHRTQQYCANCGEYK